MGHYVARRLLQMIPVFVGSTLLVFLMMYALPGDPVRALAGEKGADPSQVARLKAELGLDQPILVQYWNYLTGLFQGDFGTTIASRRPVADIIAEAWPVTAQLAIFALVFTAVVGIGMGVIAGLKPNSVQDRTLLFITLLLVSIPSFVLGRMTQTFFAFQLKWVEPNVSLEENWYELLMPAAVLAALSLAYVARLTRTSVVENLRSDYIRTAVAKGLPRRRVVGVHLVRNSMIPVVTYLGADLGALLAGAVVTEGIFNIHGIGLTVFEALGKREGSTVVGIVSLIVMVYLIASLLVDLLYAVLDPRIRYA